MKEYRRLNTTVYLIYDNTNKENTSEKPPNRRYRDPEGIAITTL